MNGMAELLTVPEACRALRIGRSTLYRLFAGRPPLRQVKIGDRTLVNRADIDNYVHDHTSPRRAPKF